LTIFNKFQIVEQVSVDQNTLIAVVSQFVYKIAIKCNY